MSKTRLVQQGEHLSGIAAQEGFANFHTIWDRPENEELRSSLHRDPHVLFPGDSLFVPDREDREESRATDASHTFQTEMRPLFLRVKLLDINGDPIAGANSNVTIDGAAAPDVASGGDGMVEQRIGRTATAAELTVHLPPADDGPPDPTWKLPVKIGSLNPVTKCSGQQARLNNMGYFAGFSVKDLEQLVWAAEEFMCDQTHARVTARPKLAAAPKEGEDDPATSQPEAETGVLDKAIRDKLKTAHGF